MPGKVACWGVRVHAQQEGSPGGEGEGEFESGRTSVGVDGVWGKRGRDYRDIGCEPGAEPTLFDPKNQ